jgi:hypothetical protein
VILDGISEKLELIEGIIEAGYVLIVRVLPGWTGEHSSANNGIRGLGL